MGWGECHRVGWGEMERMAWGGWHGMGWDGMGWDGQGLLRPGSSFFSLGGRAGELLASFFPRRRGGRRLGAAARGGGAALGSAGEPRRREGGWREPASVCFAGTPGGFGSGGGTNAEGWETSALVLLPELLEGLRGAEAQLGGARLQTQSPTPCSGAGLRMTEWLG